MSTGLQAALISVVAAVGSMVVWCVHGPPQRLAPDEVELATVLNDWQGEVLWVDARKRAEWEKNGVAGSVLVTLDAAEDFDALVEAAFPRLAESQRVVIYCGDPGCGSSREVAARLRALDFGPQYFALHGGWGVLAAAGMVSGSR